MGPDRQNTGFSPKDSGGGALPEPSSFDTISSPMDLDNAAVQTGSLLSDDSTGYVVQSEKRSGRLVQFLKRTDSIIVAFLLVCAGVALISVNMKKKSTELATQTSSVSSAFSTQRIPLTGFISTSSGMDFTTSNVVVNGTLTANSGLVLTPSSQPSKAILGQLYFDQNTNQMAYYNGSQYVALANQGTTVQSIAGVSGALTLGGGLSVVGSQLSVTFPETPIIPASVSSFAGLTGAITVGRGLAMNGSDLQNSGVLNIAAGTPNLIVNTDGSGNITISSVGGGSGTVTSTGGTSGRIAKFTGVQNVEDSLLSESGATVTVNGNLSITGTISLSAPLSVAQGGTGAATLATDGVLIGQGAGAITAVTAAGTGLCLMSTAGTPAFQACPSGSGVSSVDGLTGALTIANTTGVGTTITINDATTAAKGIASFNSTNLSVTAGTVNTVQNINMTATPTFSGVNTNTITPSGAFTVGATGQNFTLQGATGSTITATNGGNTTTLSFQAATANVNYRFTTTSAGTYDICTTAGNCVGVGGSVTTPGGTTGALAKFTGAQTLADSIISDNGTLATITGNASITGSLVLGTALGVGNGGTGATSLTSNGVVIGNGTGALTAVTAGGVGQCLVSTVGAPAFQACPGSGGVTSVNGLTGAISIANANGAGATITINDASTGAKGIASFNSTNFTVSSGAVNTIQDIATTSAPTFGQLVLTSSQASNPMLVINNTNVGASGALLDLQVNGASRFSVQPNGNTATSGTINGQTISSSANFTGTMAVTGNTTLTGDIAVNGGDVTSAAALNITPGGTLTVGSGSQTLALQGGSATSLVVTSGANTTTVNFQAPTANVTYRIPTAAAGTYDICTTVGNCAGSGGGVTTAGGTTNRLSKFTGAQAIGDSTITDNGTTVTTTVNMVVQGGTLTSGVANSQTGTLVLAYGSASASGTITPGTLTTNRTYTLPDTSGTFCLNGSSSCGFATGTGAAFVQGGNTFGVDGDLGTNDTTALNIRTNNTTRLTISSSGNASFTGDVAVNGGDITSSGALNVTPSGTLTLGSSAQTLAMQGGSSSSLVVTNGGNTTTVNFQAPTATVAYRFATAAAGTYDICTTVGNCTGTGGGVTTGGGATNRLAKFTAGQVINDSTITDNGTTVTTTANFVIQGGTGTIGVAGSQDGTLALAYSGGNFTGTIGTAALTGNQTYTLPDASGTFCLTSGNCLGPVGSGANISLSNLSSVAINTSLLPGSTTIDLGATGNAFRNLYLAGSSVSPGSNYFTVTGTATGARTITLPDASGTVCLNGSSSCGFATGTGAAFVDGGNNFGGTANLGTNSNDDLNIRTNSTTRITIAANGSAVTLASNVDLLMQGASAYISNAQGTTGGEAFGNSATTANGALAIGNSAASAANGIAVGNSANAASTSSIALGRGATTTASNQMVIGADGYEIDHIYVGSGVADATPTNFTLQGTGGSGTNVAGASVAISGGAGTGNADGGSINFQVATPGTSGSSANVPTTVFSLSGNNGSALFKNVTNSGTALDVQTAGGTSVFAVDTTATASRGAAVNGVLSATGNVNSSSGALQTAGTTRVDNTGNLTNIGNITGSGAMAISASGAMTVGATGQTLTLQGSASTTLTATGGGFTTTVGFTGSPTGGVTYNFDRAATPGTYTICTSVGNCSGAAATLQSVYDNSTSPEIVLDNTRGGLTLRDNASAIGGNLFEVQDNGGSTTYFGVTASGVSVSGAAAVTGNINTSGGALQTAGTTRVDNSGNLTNIGNITGSGAITIASSGGGNDITVDGADQFIIEDVAVHNGLATFNTDADFTLAGTENITLTTTVSGTTAVNMVDGTFTNNTTSGTQNVMQLQNAAGSGTTEAMFVMDNADTDTAVNDGLLVTSAAGGITDALDVSDADIVNALNFGANTLLGTTGDVDMTYFDLTGSTGSFTSAGTATLQGGTVTVGTNSQAGSVVLYDGSSNTGNIQTAALASDRTYTLPDASGTLCLQSSTSCNFAPTTGGTGYIQNQSASQQSSSSFWVSGASRIDGTLTVPTISTASGNLTLQSATNALSLNGIDTVSANGTLAVLAGGNNSLSLNAGGTGTVNLGTSANNKTINIGVTGATANTTTVNIATSTGAAQTINIGSTSATTSLYGTVQLGSLDSVTAATRAVCRDDTTGKFVLCDSNIGSTFPFLQGGNSLGATAAFGTNDANNLQVRTNNIVRATFDQSNGLYLGLGVTNASPTAFTMAATGSSAAGAAGAALTLQGGAGASASTGSAGGNVAIAGGNAGGSGNNAGGTVTLQGGSATGSGTKGGVVVKNVSDSTTAFQIQNTATNSIFSADTINNVISVNTGVGATLTSWSTLSSTLNTGASFGGAAVANGYVYSIGGYGSGYQATVQYAPLKSDGTLGTWVTTTALPAARGFIMSAVTTYGNYMYVVGGSADGTNGVSTVYYAKLHADGTVGAWNATSALSANRLGTAVVVLYGRIYALGGGTNSTTPSNTIYYAEINSDGTLTPWVTDGTTLPVTYSNASAIVANGRMYYMGGTNSGGTSQTGVYYATIDPLTGDVGSWTTNGTSLPTATSSASAIYYNGYAYIMNGGVATYYYAPVTSAGAVGSWSSQISMSPMTTRTGTTTAQYNGFFYAMGGFTGGVGQTTIYSTSASRVKISGALDLVSATDGVVGSDGSTGGSLTAGDTNIVGMLNVQSQANFSQDVAIIGNITVGAENDTSKYNTMTIKSNGYAGFNLNGDFANTSGEPGGAFINMGVDANTTIGTIGLAQNAGLSPDGLTTVTSALGNALLVGTTIGSGATQIISGDGSGNGVARITVVNGATTRVCIAMTTCNNSTLGVTGTIRATSTITASTTPDIAETIAAAPDVEAADVVMADPNNTERVVKSSGAYQGAALGVISDGSSSFMINAYANDAEAPLNGAPLVLAGRVPVKVTMEGGQIKPGDYLTTSSTPGKAMKATHAGATIGKALGFYDGANGDGTVLVLVNISYYDPGIQGPVDGAFMNLNAAGTVNIGGDLTVTGSATFGSVRINGKIMTGGATPQVLAETSAGAGAQIVITGNDTAGKVEITTGSSPAADSLAKITFNDAYIGGKPEVVITPVGKASAGLMPYVDITAQDGFMLGASAQPQANTKYIFTYHVLGVADD